MTGLSPRWNIVIKSFAVFGAAALTLFITFLLLVLARGKEFSPLLSSLLEVFYSAKEEILVRAEPAAVAAGGKLNISWRHEAKSEEGIYELRYFCVEGVAVRLASGENLECSKPFHPSGVSSLTLIASSSRSDPAQVSVSVGFVPRGSREAKVSGSVTIAVSPLSAGQGQGQSVLKPSGGTPVATPRLAEIRTKVYPVGPQLRTLPGGVPDLGVRIIDIGMVDEASGDFVHATSTRRGAQAAVVFEVSNIGTAVSKKWQFAANLPINYGDFQSELQSELAPGDRVRFTLGFRHPRARGANQVVITVDPRNELRDANRDNDYATTTIISE